MYSTGQQLPCNNLLDECCGAGSTQACPIGQAMFVHIPLAAG